MFATTLQRSRKSNLTFGTHHVPRRSRSATCSFSAPIMQHTLGSSPCAGRVKLTQFDALLRSALSKICNISLTDDQGLQASLPVRVGGLGIRRVSSLATPAFIAFAAVGTRNLQDQILNTAPGSYSELDIYQFTSYSRGRLTMVTCPR